MKNVAYIQRNNLLTKQQIYKYMGNINNLSSNDPIKIYKFIVCCNKKYKITNFCLNIPSGILKDFKLSYKNKSKIR